MFPVNATRERAAQAGGASDAAVEANDASGAATAALTAAQCAWSTANAVIPGQPNVPIARANESAEAASYVATGAHATSVSLNIAADEAEENVVAATVTEGWTQN